MKPSPQQPNESALPWRLRSDLQIQGTDTGAGVAWTIKDPLRLSYFYAEAEEMEFLKLLDGRNSLNGILNQLRQQFPQTEFAVDNLRQFLLSSVNGGLLIALVPGHSQRLNAIRKRQLSRALLQRSLSLLSYRFRGIDPSVILTFLDRKIGWIFQVRYMILGLLFSAFATLMVFARRSQLESELPAIGSLFTASNLPALALSVLFVKILHELGHGLTCRHYGGECHELGVLVVGFMPLLYCDVSDSWLQQDPRKRMLVSAAGIGTELFLAAAFAMLWTISRGGFLHTFFLNVMLVSSLNTVLVNGNPLLKYDGYYVVSDWLRIPNLAGESRAAAVGILDQIILGSTSVPMVRRAAGFYFGLAAYGIASMIYRVLVITTLLWFMHETLKTWHLESLTMILIVSVLAGLSIAAFYGMRERFHVVRTSEVPQKKRAIIGLCVTACVLLLALFVPFPYSVNAPFTLTPGVSLPVFALEDGEITQYVSAGDVVKAGDTIAILNNPVLDSALAHSLGELSVAKVRANALATQRSVSSQAASALPAAEKAVTSRQARFETLSQKAETLNIVSPVAGTVFPARNRPRPKSELQNGAGWFGQPLDPEIRSAWMTRQTLLCWIGTEKDLRAFCLLPQEDIDLVHEDAAVTLTFASMPSATVNGRVCQRKTIPEMSVDRELIANRMISVSGESNRPFETLFGVAVSVESNLSHGIPPLYSSGYAKIQCKPVSLAHRAWRFICHTFKFQ
jgi:putative peptide zinc metalloprotease protein